MSAGSPVPGLVRLPVAALIGNPLNARRHLTNIAELAQSIRETGLLQPLLVEHRVGQPYVVIAGHRRLAAVKQLGQSTVVCRVVTKMTAVDHLAAIVVENGQRANLDPIEEARAIDQLMRIGHMTQAQVAARIGKSQTHVSHRLTMLAIPVEQQEQVQRREIRIQDAVQLGRQVKGTAEQTRFTGWHLGKTHPLADTVRAACTTAGHGVDRRVGGVGCGACWETAIRADERTSVTAEVPQ